MSNSFYVPTGTPGTAAQGLSALVRAEFALIAAGFALLPTLAGNANKVVVVNSGGTGLTVTTSPTLSSLTVSGTASFNASIHVDTIQDVSGGGVSILGGLNLSLGDLNEAGSGVFTGDLTAGSFKVGSNQVIGARRTGWTAPTGTLSRGAFDQSSVTLAQLAQHVAALITDGLAHGFIGA